MGSLDALLQRDRAGPGGRRAGVARGMARAHRQRGAVRVRVASPPAPRRLLEAGLRLRGLRRDRVSRLRDRRLGRRVLRGRAAARGGPRCAVEGAYRPVVALVPGRGRARARHRLPPGVPALVGPVAEGRGHRHRGRAAVARVDAGAGGPRSPTRGARRALGGGGGLALAEHRGATAVARRRPARGGARRGWPPARDLHRPALRSRQRRVVRRRQRGRQRRRPASRGRPRAQLHVGACSPSGSS